MKNNYKKFAAKSGELFLLALELKYEHAVLPRHSLRKPCRQGAVLP